MGLPKIEKPMFELTVPSTQQKIKFTPFTVKQEKALLIAQESKDWDQIILSLQQLLTNCIVDDIDIDKLSMFDIEFIMLHIRAKSVNNVIQFTINDPVSQKPVELELDIDKLEVKFPENDLRTITISDDYVLKLRYPTIKEMNMAKELESKNVETLFNMMVSCIESVVNGDTVYKLKDFSQAEIVEFVDDLPKTAIDKLKEFFENMPTVSYTAKWKTEEGEDREVPIVGLDNFFI